MAKSKLIGAVLLVGILAIIALAVFKINQANMNHQEILIKSEECLQKNGTVVVEEEGFLSLPVVHCE